MKMKNIYKVSVIIPVFNGTNYVEEAINSVLNQAYKNVELIVVNDGSSDTDKLEQIISKYKNNLKYLSKKNGGVSSALNEGLKNATGDFFVWLSHDDLLSKKSIEIKLKKWIKDGCKENEIIGSYSSFIDENGKKLPHLTLQPKDISNPVDLTIRSLNGCSLLIPINLFKNRTFSTSLKYMPDYDMWVRLLNDGAFIRVVKRRITLSRIHSSQVTNTSHNLYESEFKSYFDKYLRVYFANNHQQELVKLYKALASRCFRYPFYNDYCKEIEDYLINNNLMTKSIKKQFKSSRSLSSLLGKIHK